MRTCVILEYMADDRSQADRTIVAQLTGEACHRAKWRALTAAEETAAVAELQALADGRADLLAEVAGIFEGTSEGELDEPLARSAAQLCRKAGADPEAIPAWVQEGRRRRQAADRPPFSGGVHGGERAVPDLAPHQYGLLRGDQRCDDAAWDSGAAAGGHWYRSTTVVALA